MSTDSDSSSSAASSSSSSSSSSSGPYLSIFHSPNKSNEPWLSRLIRRSGRPGQEMQDTFALESAKKQLEYIDIQAQKKYYEEKQWETFNNTVKVEKQIKALHDALPQFATMEERRKARDKAYFLIEECFYPQGFNPHFVVSAYAHNPYLFEFRHGKGNNNPNQRPSPFEEETHSK